jgi:hypothetical protein
MGHYEANATNNGFGVVTGTATATALPDIRAVELTLMARTPGAPVFIGTGGATSWPISAGTVTGPFPISNLNEIFYSGTGSYLHYWFQN